MKTNLILFFLFVSSYAQFKVYIFNVGQADSQLIVYPSGYSILVDLGEERNDPNPTNAIRLEKKIEEILGKKYIDVVVLTHIHLDHFGYYGISGLWHLFEVGNFTAGKFIERNVGNYTGENRKKCNNETYEFYAAGEFEKYSIEWVCYADSIKDQTKVSKIREIANICSITQINPPDNDSEVEIFTSNGYGAVRWDGSPVESNYYNQPMMPSENDYSIGLRIKYGNFIYATSGDLDGGYYYSYGTTINNIEVEVKDIVGSVDVLRANHHGSKHSNSWDYLSITQPVVSIISCGFNNTYGHPHPNAAYRLTQMSQKVFTTNICNSKVSFNNYYEMVDDIIITVNSTNATQFSISNSDNSYYELFNIKTRKQQRKICIPPSNEFDDSSSILFTLLIILLIFFI
ncbi:hypothetical protein EDI_272900 [Entamoeba dispar SAW760]|uniref:Competence protein ComEC n=1 Tax=Entamoeba dispar (strain ATCC PRA-260 / SAW760) TaxID=370354 RepID=B0EU38_ENTDS|nr:uncharacterized protein EDI_272900 [Entamoeba dispar SAW760]EDR21955.1 hypothetical protein EDI_272900 [Entamoeba dispar SAW760]|eukprot:EDR21955.1 hypothetical protein EDI_272900 [Entamoeba dispar SAW760]